jgi:benzoate-CoA ligase
MVHPTIRVPDRYNFARHILERNAGRGRKVAYIDDTWRLTYAELDQRVRACAAGLLALGIAPEGRVLLIMQDSVDLPIVFLGALLAGVVPVPVNTLLPPEDHAYMLRDSGAGAVIAFAEKD